MPFFSENHICYFQWERFTHRSPNITTIDSSSLSVISTAAVVLFASIRAAVLNCNQRFTICTDAVECGTDGKFYSKFIFTSIYFMLNFKNWQLFLTAASALWYALRLLNVVPMESCTVSSLPFIQSFVYTWLLKPISIYSGIWLVQSSSCTHLFQKGTAATAVLQHSAVVIYMYLFYNLVPWYSSFCVSSLDDGCAMNEAICRSGGRIQRAPDYSGCRSWLYGLDLYAVNFDMISQ